MADGVIKISFHLQRTLDRCQRQWQTKCSTSKTWIGIKVLPVSIEYPQNSIFEHPLRQAFLPHKKSSELILISSSKQPIDFRSKLIILLSVFHYLTICPAELLKMKTFAIIVVLFTVGVVASPTSGLVNRAEEDICPPPEGCYYDGTAPFCFGGCNPGYNECSRSDSGCGVGCWTGQKAFCCKGACPP
jgi:hypothetical protein